MADAPERMDAGASGRGRARAKLPAVNAFYAFSLAGIPVFVSPFYLLLLVTS